MAKASDNAFPSILITEGTEPSAPAAGKQRLYIDSTSHHLKRTNSSGTDVDIEAAAGGTGGYIGYILLRDQKASGTEGGGFTSGSYQTRVLNTEVFDTNNDCTLASNQITLAAGTYECRIVCPAAVCNSHKAKLRNVTDGADVLVGKVAYADSTNVVANESEIAGRFTIGASKALEVQHRCATTRNVNGFGVCATFGDTEVYTVAEFWRVS